MNVSLAPELEKFVNERVESGLYRSASEVVREALRLLAEKEEERQAKLEALRGLIEESLERGNSKEWDLEETKRKFRERKGKKNG